MTDQDRITTELLGRLDTQPPSYVWTCEPLIIGCVLVHRLECFSLGAHNWGGEWRVRIGYRMYLGDLLVFEGVDFFAPPGSDDGRKVAFELLGFLTLRPGDVGDDWFDDYTDAQIEWRDTYAEDLIAEVYAQADGMTS